MECPTKSTAFREEYMSYSQLNCSTNRPALSPSHQNSWCETVQIYQTFSLISFPYHHDQQKCFIGGHYILYPFPKPELSKQKLLQLPTAASPIANSEPATPIVSNPSFRISAQLPPSPQPRFGALPCDTFTCSSTRSNMAEL